ncbi:hypothetical protein G4B88_000999, partial [Cannabis sativa]
FASSNDVRVTPHVQFNYFSHPKDLSQCVSAVKKIGEVLSSKSMERFKMVDSNEERNFMYFGPSLPTNQSDESAMEEFCRSSVTTIWHYHGGCTVGKVVDGDFRVMGVNSLRVVDGSTFSCLSRDQSSSHYHDVRPSDESAMEEFCRSSVTTIWHYHGGCTVGKVVDGDFRVMGVNSLRVVDGSTFSCLSRDQSSSHYHDVRP